MLQELDVLIGFAVVMSMASLLIMVTTQAIASVLGLRGQNLRDALVALFVKFKPDLKPEIARKIAVQVLQDPVYSDSSLPMKSQWPGWWKLSSAIRASECLEVLKNIAATDPTLKQDAAGLIDAIAKSPLATAADSAVTAIKAAVPAAGDVTQVAQHLNSLIDATESATHLELQRWKAAFSAAQDRAEQWFTMNSRWSTVVLAFATAFLLQLDTFELFTRLSSDDSFRNGLVNLSAAVQKRADEAMNDVSPGTVYFAVLKQLHNQDSDIKKFAEPEAGNGQSYSTATDWLTNQGKKLQPPLDNDKLSQMIQRFDNAVQAKSKEQLEFAEREFSTIAAFYNQPKLQLLPEPYPHDFIHFLGYSNGAGIRHFFGMFATAMLLALGAPFWFNLLKSLTNLRSSVADTIDKENEKAQAKPS